MAAHKAYSTTPEYIARTRRTYDGAVAQVIDATRTRSDIVERRQRFAAALAAGARVLDAGCGPGDDSAVLRSLGLRAVGLDLSFGLLQAGSALFPAPRVNADLRHLPFADGSFAAVWACASLLHLAADEIGGALVELRRVLPVGGLVYVAVKEGEGAAWESQRYGAPRWFQYWRAAAFDAALCDAGFAITEAETVAGTRDTWLLRSCAAR